MSSIYGDRLQAERGLAPETGRRQQMAETAYCVKCKAKTDMKNAEKVTMKNGRPAMKGVCSTCGTGVYKILSMKK